jgi:hypothetical protein
LFIEGSIRARLRAAAGASAAAALRLPLGVGVLRSRDDERGLVERAEDEVRERAHGLRRDLTGVDRRLQRGGDDAEAVGLPDLAPALPAERRSSRTRPWRRSTTAGPG